MADEGRLEAMKHFYTFVSVLVISAQLSLADEYAADEAGYRKIAQPFLAEHCISCHGEKKQKVYFSNPGWMDLPLRGFLSF